MKILRFKKLRDWNILDIDESVSLEERTLCPCCEHRLSPLALLDGTIAITVGCCDFCGYVGYMNAPSPQWLASFYLSKWDKPGIKTQRKIAYGKKESALANILERFDIQHDAPILEIGSGYGETLQYLSELGYTRAEGIEPSMHRARGQLKTFHGMFEEFCPSASYKVIYTVHVLEHLSDPLATVKKCASMQKNGGFLVITVPHKEPIMQTLLFLPHLHRYTRDSLTHLLSHGGYKLMQYYANDEEQTVVAERVQRAVPPTPEQTFFAVTAARFRSGLGEDKFHLYPTRILWWYRPLGYEEGGQLPNVPLIWQYIWRRHKKAPIQACLVANSVYPEIPVHLEFDGYIKMAYK